MAIFPIFRNGRHQFCVSVNTRKTVDPNFRRVGNWSFALGCIFGELWPFFPFSIMADTNFAFLSTLWKPETQTLGGSVIGSFALGHVFGELRPFFPFSVMANTNVPTLGKLEWPFCTQNDKMADASFPLIQFFHWFSFLATPLRFVSTFRRDLGALKVPKKSIKIGSHIYA